MTRYFFQLGFLKYFFDNKKRIKKTWHVDFFVSDYNGSLHNQVHIYKFLRTSALIFKFFPQLIAVIFNFLYKRTWWFFLVFWIWIYFWIFFGNFQNSELNNFFQKSKAKLTRNKYHQFYKYIISPRIKLRIL